MNPTCVPLVVKVSEAATVIVGIPNIGLSTCVSGSDEKISFEIAAENLIWSRLSYIGIYNDQDSYDMLMSDLFKEEDGRLVFCESEEPRLPLLRFKKIWSILKRRESDSVLEDVLDGKEVDKEDLKAAVDAENKKASLLDDVVFSSLKPIGQLTDAELLNRYSPESSSEVVEELLRRSKGRPFVAFSSERDGKIDQEITLRMLKESRKREMPIHYKVSDALYRLFVAGVFPSQVFYECPVHKGVLLLDGYCDECGHSWEGVDYKACQFVRLIVELGQCPKERPSLRQLIADARSCSSDDMNALELDYPNVAAVFRERCEEDKLPSLRSRTASSEASHVSDPFNVRTKPRF
jgi:hypothetical protein